MRIAKISTVLAVVLGLAACEQMGGGGGTVEPAGSPATDMEMNDTQAPGSTDGTEEGGAADATGL